MENHKTPQHLMWAKLLPSTWGKEFTCAQGVYGWDTPCFHCSLLWCFQWGQGCAVPGLGELAPSLVPPERLAAVSPPEEVCCGQVWKWTPEP